MEEKSTDLFQDNNLLKIHFTRNSNSYGIPITLFYFLFLKICILIYLFILLIYGLKYKKDYIKVLKSLLKTNLSRNGKSIISNKNKIEEEEIYFDKYETDIYNNIKNKIIDFQCNEMWDNQREFLNGVVRRFRPKKIVEIGVNRGCSSSIILIKI
jgi:hypothetical protein